MNILLFFMCPNCSEMRISPNWLLGRTNGIHSITKRPFLSALVVYRDNKKKKFTHFNARGDRIIPSHYYRRYFSF